MKKLLSVLVVLILTVAMFAGCSSKKTTTDKPAASTDQGSGIVKMGLGHITKIDKSKDLEAGKGALAEVDTIIVAAAFDKDGKVVKVAIDYAQNKVEFNDDLSLKSDVNAEQKTKVELKDAYGMIKASKIGKEWYQQAEALENWMVGKTVAEIKAMEVTKKDDAHPAVPAVADLTSSVTISVDGFQAAIEEAYNNAVDVEAGGEKLGLGHEVSIAKSKGITAEAGPLAQVDTIIAATLFDKDGKVVKALLDSAQTKVEFGKDGKVASDKSAEVKTKVELKEGYGMIKASKIGKEWYQEAEALGNWMEGKTVAEIKAMEVTKKDDAHPAVPAVADLTSSVTISVQDFQAAVEEAFNNAK